MSQTPEYPPSTEEMAALKERNKECHIRNSVFSFDLTKLFAYLIQLLILLMSLSIFDRKSSEKRIHLGKKTTRYSNTFCPKPRNHRSHHADAECDVDS